MSLSPLHSTDASRRCFYSLLLLFSLSPSSIPLRINIYIFILLIFSYFLEKENILRCEEEKGGTIRICPWSPTKSNLIPIILIFAVGGHKNKNHLKCVYWSDCIITIEKEKKGQKRKRNGKWMGTGDVMQLDDIGKHFRRPWKKKGKKKLRVPHIRLTGLCSLLCVQLSSSWRRDGERDVDVEGAHIDQFWGL